ncbi:sortase [Agromyces protaetiae]|uniref:Sortase n=1 Tax=Agromyces protaetiae TaxID=2509455 RepID=A0A4P6FL10_9MICO|nr:sortase [Agromyces protaetiae]QAY74707.1 sortase [Agromyces protaetiae]
MLRKILATFAVAAAVLVAAPIAANADEYPEQGTPATVAPGEVAQLGFSGLPANTPATASAPDAVTLSIIKASTLTRSTDANGAVTFGASATQPGTYTITVTAGGETATATLTVLPADSSGDAGSDSGLPHTGVDPVLWVWIGGGALLLGAALVIVLTTVRRNRSE